MQKQIKITYILLVIAILASVGHNMVYALVTVSPFLETAYFKIVPFFGIAFFFLSLIAFVVFLVSVIYNLVTYIKAKVPADLWKIGFIGLFGLIGISPRFRFLLVFCIFLLFFLQCLTKKKNTKK